MKLLERSKVFRERDPVQLTCTGQGPQEGASKSHIIICIVKTDELYLERFSRKKFLQSEIPTAPNQNNFNVTWKLKKRSVKTGRLQDLCFPAEVFFKNGFHVFKRMKMFGGGTITFHLCLSF